MFTFRYDSKMLGSQTSSRRFPTYDKAREAGENYAKLCKRNGVPDLAVSVINLSAFDLA